MTCPRCGVTFSRTPTECGSCGFSAGELEKRLGAHAVVVNRLVDTAHGLRLRDSLRLEALLDEFERRFPQCFCTVFVGLMPGDVSVSEGGFWLLNHAVRTCQGEVRNNQFGIALIIDPSTHSAGLSLGRAVAALVSNEQSRELLRRVTPALWHGDYARAITGVVKGFDKLLRKHGRARQRPSLLGWTKPKTLFGFELAAPAEKPAVEVET